MKRLLITLLVFGTVNLEASNGQYHSSLSQKMVTMTKREWKYTPFFKYAHDGNWSEMQKILKSIPEDRRNLFINTSDKHGETALFRAVFAGRPEIVRLLLRNGANASQTNHVGISALEGAAAMIKAYDPYFKNQRVKKDVLKKAWGH